MLSNHRIGSSSRIFDGSEGRRRKAKAKAKTNAEDAKAEGNREGDSVVRVWA
jgi:hypothetical protein